MGYSKITYYGKTLIDLTEDSVTPERVLAGTSYHDKNGDEATGTMPNKGAVSGTIATADGAYTVAAGYHNGSGKVAISPAEQAKLIPGNIPLGLTILGVVGTYKTQYNGQQKAATPGTAAQTITPDTGYDGLTKVTVAAVPYTETENSSGGITVVIG